MSPLSAGRITSRFLSCLQGKREISKTTAETSSRPILIRKTPRPLMRHPTPRSQASQREEGYYCGVVTPRKLLLASKSFWGGGVS